MNKKLNLNKLPTELLKMLSEFTNEKFIIKNAGIDRIFKLSNEYSSGTVISAPINIINPSLFEQIEYYLLDENGLTIRNEVYIENLIENYFEPIFQKIMPYWNVYHLTTYVDLNLIKSNYNLYGVIEFTVKVRLTGEMEAYHWIEFDVKLRPHNVFNPLIKDTQIDKKLFKIWTYDEYYDISSSYVEIMDKVDNLLLIRDLDNLGYSDKSFRDWNHKQNSKVVQIIKKLKMLSYLINKFDKNKVISNIKIQRDDFDIKNIEKLQVFNDFANKIVFDFDNYNHNDPQILKLRQKLYEIFD